MITDKELNIEFLKEEAPKLYEQLKSSGELNSLTGKELIARYAASQTEPLTDISDMTVDDVPPVDMTAIKTALKKAKLHEIKEQSSRSDSLTGVILKKLAAAAVITALLAIGLHSAGRPEKVVFEFKDFTSQETTDYAIRVHAEHMAAGVFHDELVSEIDRLLIKEAAILHNGKSFICSLLPVNDGMSVQLKIQNADYTLSCSEYIKLDTKESIYRQLAIVIPRMLNEVSR